MMGWGGKGDKNLYKADENGLRATTRRLISQPPKRSSRLAKTGRRSRFFLALCTQDLSREQASLCVTEECCVTTQRGVPMEDAISV